MKTVESVFDVEEIVDDPQRLVEERYTPATARVPGSSFSRAVALAAKVSDSKSQLAGLLAVEMVPDQNVIRILGIDLWSTAIEMTVGAKINAEETVSFTVSAKALASVAGILPDDVVDVSILPKQNRLQFRWHRNEIGLRGTVETPHNAFRIADGKSLGTATLAQSEFDDLFVRAVPFASKDDARPALKGLSVVVESSGITVAATDGFGLFARKREIAVEGARDAGLSVIVSPSHLPVVTAALKQLGEDRVRMEFLEKSVVLTVGSMRMAIGYIEAKFPDYQPIIPQGDMRLSVYANTHEWRQAFKVSKIAGEAPYLSILIPLDDPDDPEADSVESPVIVESRGGPHKSTYELPALVEFGKEIEKLRDDASVYANGGIRYYPLPFNPDLVMRGVSDEIVLSIDLNTNTQAIRVRDQDAQDGEWLTILMPVNQR